MPHPLEPSLAWVAPPLAVSRVFGGAQRAANVGLPARLVRSLRCVRSTQQGSTADA